MQISTTEVRIEGERFIFSKLHHISGDNRKSVTKGSIQKEGESGSKISTIFKKYTNNTFEHLALAEIRKKMLTLTLGFMERGYQIFMLAAECDLQVFKRRNGFSEKEATIVLVDILIQLEILSEKCNHVHNDVKPNNIVLYKEKWYLIDYEMSRMYTLLNNDGYCMEDGFLIVDTSGTEGFNAPEKEKHGYISPKGDVFSLGVSIQKLLNPTEECSIFEDANESCLSVLLSQMTKDSILERFNARDCLQELANIIDTGYIQSRKNHFVNADYFIKMISSNQLP